MNGTLARICRHPLKGHGREALASVRLSAGACLPYDRHWAVAHALAKLGPGWNSCTNFARGAKAPQLMAIECTFDEAQRRLTLRHPERGEIVFSPDDPADLPGFLDWVRPLNPQERPAPTAIVHTGTALTDSDFPSVSIVNLASLAALSDRMGMALSAERFRANLWLEGAEPFAEWGWIGRTITIGGAVLRIEERITRCRATMADPATGAIAGDTLSALQTAYGHQDFGVYARVLQGGLISLSDPWSIA